MGDNIDKSILILEEIASFYKGKVEKKENDLINASKEVESKFKEILDDNAKENLKSQTSVNPILYYGLKSRVKSPESFKEKLIRKNLGFRLISEFAITSKEDFLTKRNKIYKKIILFDDIIGIRIVTELKEDCKSVHELLLEVQDKLVENDIVINVDEINEQPEKMQNGLPIYRMKGVYEEKYGFELQIKSKIEEAWGDLDHNIFYKDYSITPIKNTVQETMNHVGKLLDKIEYLLLGLRKSNKEYEKNLKQLVDLKEIDEELTEIINNKIKVNFDVSKIASFIVFFRNELNVESKADKITNLNFDNLGFETNDNFQKNYIQIRTVCFELQIIETLYFNWAKNKGRIINTEKKYEKNLNVFIDLFIKHLSEKILENKELLDNELGEFSILKSRIIKLVEKYKSNDIFISTSKHIKLINIENQINSFFEENPPHHDDDFCKEILEIIKNLLLSVFYDQNIKDSNLKLTKFLNEHEDDIDKNQIENILIDLKNNLNVDRNKEMIKITEKTLNIIKNGF